MAGKKPCPMAEVSECLLEQMDGKSMKEFFKGMSASDQKTKKAEMLVNCLAD